MSLNVNTFLSLLLHQPDYILSANTLENTNINKVPILHQSLTYFL